MISNSDVINWVLHNSRVWESNGNYYTTFQGKHFLLSIQVNEAPYARTRLVGKDLAEEIDPPKWEYIHTRGSLEKQVADVKAESLSIAEEFAYNVITETNPHVWAKIMEREAEK